MAINAGTVYYTVDADTQEAINNTNKMNDSLGDLSVQLAKNEQQIKKYKSELQKANSTISNTGVVIDEFGNVNEIATKKLQNMMVQVNSTNNRIGELSKTATAVKSGIAGIGRGAGQAGIQVQQFIGQIQGGQSAMLALSQQSADLGFVLGMPLLGAVVGISASIAGMLLPELFSTTDALEGVEKATENVRAALTLSADGVTGYSEQMKVLAQVSEQLARIKLANLIAEQSAAMKKAADGIDDTLDDFRGLNYEMELFGTRGEDASRSFIRLSEATKAFKLDPNNSIGEFEQALLDAERAGINTTESGRKLVSTMTDLIAQFKMGEITINDLKKQLDGTKLEFDSASSSAQKYIDIADRLNVRTEKLRSKQLELEKAITLKKAKEAEATPETIKSIETSYDKIIANEREAESERNLAKQIRDKAAADREAEQAKKQAMIDDQASADVMINLKAQSDQNKSLLGQLDPMEGEQQRYQLELDNLKKLNEAKLLEDQRYLELKGLAEIEHEENMQQLREEAFKKQSANNELLMNSLDMLQSAGTSAISGILSGTMSATEAMRSFANSILNEAVGALVSMGIQYLKNQVIAQSAAAASVATGVATGTALASAYAPAATLASIATLGAAATTGGTAVAAAVAANQALGLVGMAHDGIGEVPTEGTWLLNKGERVYTNDSAQKLDQMYSQIVSPSYPSQGAISAVTQPQQPAINLKFEIINNADGVQHETQLTDEGVRIIATNVAQKVFNENIDKGVSGVLGKKGTKTNKTLTSKYDTRNKY